MFLYNLDYVSYPMNTLFTFIKRRVVFYLVGLTFCSQSSCAKLIFLLALLAVGCEFDFPGGFGNEDDAPEVEG